ncbi:diacylglycerol/lipid kinase family protein [Kiritimatiella glycovorans]|uniref:Diacylglycerol kinase n=1 Tax=Kiritimatiella glycovorans TaxID=1307763 RepID=A0A0G3EC97_9BACT|nr:diacylglycerol kinase family protein [Kiritimatiella glycovorans]AKJ64136.1 Diacylglycerol kinase [Kiritimatiella glycovorans]
MERVRVFVNPRSGFGFSPSALKAISETWEDEQTELTFQYSHSAEDGSRKARRAVEEGIDTILVMGGDGMINSIGGALLDTEATLGVIPAGSGNGFARHFNIPLPAEQAARALRKAKRRRIDVGLAAGRPFFVTCSMAWDAAIVRTFEKFPFRGPLPYVFAGVYELFDYHPQPLEVELDGDRMHLDPPLVFTVANLTQYGNNACIAPHAQADDGRLEMVYMPNRDAPRFFTNLHRLFDRTLDTLPGVLTRSFRHMCVRRENADPLQMDGELVDAPRSVEVEVRPGALTVLVPDAE